VLPIFTFKATFHLGRDWTLNTEHWTLPFSSRPALCYADCIASPLYTQESPTSNLRQGATHHKSPVHDLHILPGAETAGPLQWLCQRLKSKEWEFDFLHGKKVYLFTEAPRRLQGPAQALFCLSVGYFPLGWRGGSWNCQLTPSN